MFELFDELVQEYAAVLAKKGTSAIEAVKLTRDELIARAKEIAAKKGLPQKVKALIEASKVGGRPGILPTFSVIRPYESVKEEDLPSSCTRLFVRPCPYTPNHGAKVAGFESTMVRREKVLSHIKMVQDAMLEHAPDAALLVMPYIQAKLSAVAAPNCYIAIGKEHNGITAGTSSQVVLPLEKESTHWIELSGEKPEKVELEFVYGDTDHSLYDDGAPFLVQLRRTAEHVKIGAPPTTDARPGFVPKGSMTVKSIYVVKDLEDLGELEVLKEMDTDGLLVIQPTGSLLSHASAHCRGAGIAFVIDYPAHYAPGCVISDAAGWVVKGSYEGASYDPKSYEAAFWDGCEVARTNWARDWGRLSTFFHQFTSVPLGDADKTAYLAGAFVGWLAMAGLAACLGESRHAYGQCYGAPSSVRTMVKPMLKELVPSLKNKDSVQRSYIYAGLLEIAPTWVEVAHAAKVCRAIFGYGWNAGYGGSAWASCSEGVMLLASAIEKRDFGEVLQLANRVENESHNNGSLFTKHIEMQFFDAGTAGFNLSDLRIPFLVAERAFEILESDMQPRPPAADWPTILTKAEKKLNGKAQQKVQAAGGQQNQFGLPTPSDGLHFGKSKKPKSTKQPIEHVKPDIIAVGQQHVGTGQLV